MMKKIYKTMFVAGAALALTACSNEEPGYDNGVPGANATVTFSVEVPSTMGTRAFNDGTKAEDLTIIVFDKDGNYLFQDVREGVFEGSTLTKNDIKIDLITGETYTVAFWVDAPAPEGGTKPYSFTKGVLSVNYVGAVANDDSRDAFYNKVTLTVAKNDMTRSVSLYRPFAQVNLGASDFDYVTDKMGYDVNEISVNIKGGVYSKMNMLNGEVDPTSLVEESTGVTFAAAAIDETATLAANSSNYAWIGMNYVLCAEGGSTASSISFTTDDARICEQTFNEGDIPLKRNFRTNVVGPLFTNPTGWIVTLEAEPFGKWDGKKATEPVVDPVAKTVSIEKPTDLAGFADMVNGVNNTRDANQIEALNFKDFTVTLNCDVDLNNMEWTPIGKGTRTNETYEGKAFKGVFDGNGHTISGLKITNGNKADACGLFGVIDGGVVKNLNITGADINIPDCENTGIVTGLLVGGGKVENVKTYGKVVAKRGCSGVVGRLMIDGQILNCENNATISATSTNVGGICGAAYYTREGKQTLIKDCVNNGEITCKDGWTAGIAGLNTGDIVNCVNNKPIVANGACVGGIVGEQQNAGHVTKCVNKENVTNNSAGYGTGGIIGWIRYSGKVEDYTVKNIVTVSECVNHGSVAGGNDAGGIVGTLYHLGEVKDNENYAASLQGVKFAAGIVGNIQFTESTPGLNYDDSVVVKDNVSTTSIDNISAGCKGLYFYDNDSNHGKVKAEGNRQSK